MGQCSVQCAKFSYVQSISSAASHTVFLWFQHWLVYVDVFCYWHGRPERWLIEKISRHISDIKNGPQVIQNKDVFFSCSTYRNHNEFDNFKSIYNNYNLADIFIYILSRHANGYRLLRDNCRIFKIRIWKDLHYNLF